jgi:hypothetical protein
MKYLKKFEDNNLKYRVGDWVKIKIIPDFVHGIERIDDNLFVKIENIQHDKNYGQYDSLYEFKTLLTNQMIFGNQYYIRRKMTKKEIKDFKIKIEAQKYNI